MDHSAARLIALEDGWKEIKEKAIDVLFQFIDNSATTQTTRLFANDMFMTIYTTCYNMCTQRTPFNWSEQLYQRHGAVVSEYLEQKVVPSLRDKHGKFLVKELVYRWNNHKVTNKWLKRFFMYLDRYYVKHHSLPSLSDACLQSFKTTVFETFKRDVMTAMLEVINEEREGAVVDRTLISECVDLFEAMGMGTLETYTADFEEPLLENTQEYYARKSQVWIESDSTPDYLIKAEKAIEEEKARVTNYLNSATEPKLVRVCNKEMLEVRLNELLEKEGSGLASLLANDQSDHLARMYRLYSRIPQCLHPIAAIVKKHITEKGNDIIDRREGKIEQGEKDSNQDPTVVKELLALHDKYNGVVNDQFQANAIMSKALQEAFGEFVNRDVAGHKTADLMSNFCDRLLKTGGEKLSDGEVEEFLGKVIVLFSYLADKDLFAELYRQQLAKRLLNQRSASDDSERLVIQKLKLAMGSQFTSKLEGMMNDINIGADHAADFTEYYKTRSESHGLKIDFQVQVLAIGHWPTYKAMNVTLTPEMTKCTALFKEYYDSKNSKHRLAWMHGLGNVTVKSFYPKRKTYDLEVATVQAAALMIFSASDVGELTLDAITNQMNLPVETVKKILHSLSMCKYKVLSRKGGEGALKPTDRFCFNEKFACPLRKLRIPLPSLEENTSMKRVEEDRGNAIEAAIVRIMKARKTLGHQQLVAEVLAQLQAFTPNPKLIKRKIESLIDREYLERDEGGTNSYKYLA